MNGLATVLLWNAPFGLALGTRPVAPHALPPAGLRGRDPEPAMEMLTRPLGAGGPVGRVTGDEVHGRKRCSGRERSWASATSNVARCLLYAP